MPMAERSNGWRREKARVVTGWSRHKLVTTTFICRRDRWRGQATRILEARTCSRDSWWQNPAPPKPQITGGAITQHITESMHAPPAFGGEGMSYGDNHLGLHAWSGFESRTGVFGRMRSQRAQPFPHDGIGALTESAQFLMQSNCGQIRIALQQLRDRSAYGSSRLGRGRDSVSITPALRSCCWPRFASRRLLRSIRATRAMLRSEAPVARRRTISLRVTSFIQCLNSLSRSRLRAATDPASRDKFLKTRRQHDAIFGRQTRAPVNAPARLPCVQHIEQQSAALPSTLIPGFAEPLWSRHRATRSVPCESASRGCVSKVFLLPTVGASEPEIDHATEFRARQRLAPDGFQNFGPWLPSGNRTICRAAVGANRPTRSSSARFGPRRSIRARRRHTQLLWRSQQFGHFHLTQAVFAHQRLNDPCFFQFARAPSGAIEAVDGGLGRPLVGFMSRAERCGS